MLCWPNQSFTRVETTNNNFSPSNYKYPIWYDRPVGQWEPESRKEKTRTVIKGYYVLLQLIRVQETPMRLSRMPNLKTARLNATNPSLHLRQIVYRGFIHTKTTGSFETRLLSLFHFNATYQMDRMYDIIIYYLNHEYVFLCFYFFPLKKIDLTNNNNCKKLPHIINSNKHLKYVKVNNCISWLLSNNKSIKLNYGWKEKPKG